MAKRQVFRIADLSGGVNPDQNEVLLADNEAADILNFRLDKVGSLVSRRGYTKYESLTTTDNILAVGRWKDSADSPSYDVLVATAAGKVIEFDENTGSLVEQYTGLDTAAEGQFLPLENLLVYVNGTDDPLVYDGTDMYALGISAPASAPGTSLTTGTLNGTFKYVYTYLNSTEGWESDPSAEASETPSNDGVQLSLTASTNDGVDQIRIYRTVDGGSTFLLLDTTTNATGTYDDDGSESLGSLEVRNDNDTPGTFENVAFHKGYLFGSIGDTIYWSRPLVYNAFPTDQSTRVPFEGIDTIIAIRSYQDTLVIFGRNNIVLLNGDGGEWSLTRQDIALGVTNNRAIAEIDGSLIFLSYDGLRVFPQVQQPFAPKLSRVFSAKTLSQKQDAAMVYVPEERAIWLSIDDETWAVHIPNQAISRYSFSTSQFLRGGKDGFSLPLWIDGKNLMEYGGTQDDGENITVKWHSKIFQLANPEFVKFFRRIGAFASTGTEATVTVTITDQSNTHTVTLEATGADNTSEWDNFEWDNDNWSSEGLSYFIGALPAQSLIGRTFQVRINADTDAETEIVGPITFQYREADRFLG